MSEARRRTAAREAAADPDRTPRQLWGWDRARAWWAPVGDWAGDHGLVVMKRGRDPKWYARANHVGCVAATDTADQAKVALEMWVAMVSDGAEQRRELSRLGKPSTSYILADDRESERWSELPLRARQQVAYEREVSVVAISDVAGGMELAAGAWGGRVQPAVTELLATAERIGWHAVVDAEGGIVCLVPPGGAVDEHNDEIPDALVSVVVEMLNLEVG